jgi:hypothetical protein
VISSWQGSLPDNTQHSQQTDIHAPGGIGTHNLSMRAVADPHLRPRRHWDRYHCPYCIEFLSTNKLLSLRCGSAAAHLLGLRIRIPPGAWMSINCECYVLSSRGLCLGLITHPEESYRVWCVSEWSWSLDNEETLTHWGLLSDWGEGELIHCCLNRKPSFNSNAEARNWNSPRPSLILFRSTLPCIHLFPFTCFNSVLSWSSRLP